MARLRFNNLVARPRTTAHKALPSVLLAVGIGFASVQPVTADSRTYYRVVNDNGIIELKSTLSAKEAKRGYAIVSLGGSVIKEVPAELTDAEYAALSAELKQRENEEKLADKNRQYNESLMLRYSTVKDIEAERSRKLAEFDVRMSILRSNMMSIKDQVERQQARAADIERGGREVPDVIHNNIINLEDKLQQAEESLEVMQTEKETVENRYDKDIERFSLLTEKLQSR